MSDTGRAVDAEMQAGQPVLPGFIALTLALTVVASIVIILLGLAAIAYSGALPMGPVALSFDSPSQIAMSAGFLQGAIVAIGLVAIIAFGGIALICYLTNAMRTVFLMLRILLWVFVAVIVLQQCAAVAIPVLISESMLASLPILATLIPMFLLQMVFLLLADHWLSRRIRACDSINAW